MSSEHFLISFEILIQDPVFTMNHANICDWLFQYKITYSGKKKKEISELQAGPNFTGE